MCVTDRLHETHNLLDIEILSRRIISKACFGQIGIVMTVGRSDRGAHKIAAEPAEQSARTSMLFTLKFLNDNLTHSMVEPFTRLMIG